MSNAAQEIFFWSGIMRDHGEFQLITLSSREPQYIITSQYFKNAFISLRNEAEKLLEKPTCPAVKELISRVIPVLVNFINYKRLLVRKLLECDIELGLPPTFINHMINEAMEFYRTLCMIQTNIPRNTTAGNILLHKIWLPDAAGHAAAIASDLDATETILIKEAENFKNTFEHLFIKATELGQMLERTNLNNGSLEWLNEQVEKNIEDFIHFLSKIRDLRKKCKAMSTLKPLFPDHMIREEQYYLSNIKELRRK
ncbi:MAG: hypothetical protein PWR27_999 [Petroclostridium sp.]|jgi:hypothetical protein|uniref:DUF2935 domain-containing protein n=1 Tax=Petroclostridium xylanilyticum TaxID=1792311 RepID=UPI0018E32268|nr:DUF2935 domain-containing protein [Petroclostridium xylanilyticum]MBZ4647290.1 hypothetical protein [Clostridia bacterium]MDK2810290.1 hypothetical protein [Petroclostridium sp.]